MSPQTAADPDPAHPDPDPARVTPEGRVAAAPAPAPEGHAMLEALFVEAFHELLAAYPIGVVPTTEREVTTPAPNVAMRSIVRAKAPGVTLESVLLADMDFLAAVHPLGLEHLTTSHLQDWVGELNNQLMGRLKTKCLRRDCALELSVPRLATGSGLRTHLQRSCTYRHHRATLPEGRMCLSLAATLDPGFALGEEGSGEAVMPEGAIAFF